MIEEAYRSSLTLASMLRSTSCPLAVVNIVTLSHPCDRDIACKDAGTELLSGTKKLTVHPEHKKTAIKRFFINVNN